MRKRYIYQIQQRLKGRKPVRVQRWEFGHPQFKVTIARFRTVGEAEKLLETIALRAKGKQWFNYGNPWDI